VWRGPNNIPPGQINSSYGPGPYKYGVQWDIWAIERLLGVFGQWNGGTPSGPPLGQIVDVLFADPANPQSNNGFNFIGPTFNTGGAINITGWLQGLSVAYTRFDANMTPTRASVDIELQQVYSPGAVAPTTNNNTSSG
jgi:hypothetical protein